MDRREQLVRDYHRFLCRMALRLLRCNANARAGGTFEDWYQEAAIALLEADDRFDSSRGFKFITFATTWVWCRIRNAARNNGSLIRVAASAVKAESKYHEQASAAYCVRPLHDLDGDLSVYCDQPAPIPVDPALAPEQVQRLLSSVHPDDAEVIRLRYGLADGVFRTLREVADELGVTKERIRQREKRALERMEGVPLTL
jgi:RNA polymerase primary sigma factor